MFVPCTVILYVLLTCTLFHFLGFVLYGVLYVVYVVLPSYPASHQAPKYVQRSEISKHTLKHLLRLRFRFGSFVFNLLDTGSFLGQKQIPKYEFELSVFNRD